MARPTIDGLSPASKLVEDAKKKLSESEFREWIRLEQETNRMWKSFWARVLKRQGCSNAQIAQALALSESTVRRILKGD